MQSESNANNYRNQEAEAPPRVNEIRRIFKVMFSRWVVVFGTVVIAVLILVAIFAPLIAPYDPNKTDLDAVLAQPSREHLLGTDHLGRDLLSRVIYGSQVSLWVGFIAVGISSTIGITLGLIAGYFGRWVNNIIMRFIDAMMCIPGLVLALAIGTALGGGLKNVMIALGVALVPGYCRLMCAQVLSIKETDYVTASRALGSNDINIMLRHVLPNSFPPLLVLITLQLGTAILTEASLSFLGVGVTAPQASWGAMVSNGYKYLINNPLMSTAPGIAIMLVVLAFNMVGDGLRDALDPRLRGIL
jgi:peptide/nickel transport system permease protein